jgi:hypothetical protein
MSLIVEGDAGNAKVVLGATKMSASIRSEPLDSCWRVVNRLRVSVSAEAGAVL